MFTIPAEAALIVLVGPSGGGKSTWAAAHFDPTEIVSSDALRVELTGQQERQDKNRQVFDEFFRRILARLVAGQRVVADAQHLAQGERKKTAKIGKDLGVPVYYVVVNRPLISKVKTAGWRSTQFMKGKNIVEAYEETYQAVLPVIKTGDGLAKAVLFAETDDIRVAPMPAVQVEWETSDFTRVAKLIKNSTLHQNRNPKVLAALLYARGFRRIRVIGDVHGNLEGLAKVMQANPDTFFLFLGDIPDYGVGTLTAVVAVAKLIREGRAWCIRGNHEKKVLRYVEQERANGFQGMTTHGNNVTFNQLKALDADARAQWETEMEFLVEMSPDWIQIGQFLFVHAAAHHSMWGNELFRANGNSIQESFALYGETDGTKGPDGYPTRLYNWVDAIPTGHTVFVGHAVRQVEAPLVQMNAGGGKVVFLDTGSSKEKDGKPGKLSWVDLDIRPETPSQLHWVGWGSE